MVEGHGLPDLVSGVLLGERHPVHPNPYEPTTQPSSDVAPVVHADGAEFPKHPAVKLCSGLLVVFILYIGIGGLLARIEPEELAMTIVLDVLAGVAFIGLLAINTPGMFRPPHVWRRIVPALIVAAICSGTLIGWHCLTLHMRRVEIQRQEQKERSEFRETVK